MDEGKEWVKEWMNNDRKGRRNNETKEGKIRWTKWIKGGWKEARNDNECTIVWKEWGNEKMN